MRVGVAGGEQGGWSECPAAGFPLASALASLSTQGFGEFEEFLREDTQKKLLLGLKKEMITGEESQ